VTPSNAPECIAAGAVGVAVIRGLAQIRELAAAL
jgi:thiamine monophosphate synthase